MIAPLVLFFSLFLGLTRCQNLTIVTPTGSFPSGQMNPWGSRNPYWPFGWFGYYRPAIAIPTFFYPWAYFRRPGSGFSNNQGGFPSGQMNGYPNNQFPNNQWGQGSGVQNGYPNGQSNYYPNGQFNPSFTGSGQPIPITPLSGQLYRNITVG